MESKFLYLPRADSFTLSNEHDIYRKYKVPGKRESDHYTGTGIEQTYNMSVSDKPMPKCEDAVPALVEVEIGNGRTKSIMRKSVKHKTVKCPECKTDCVADGGETFCPECGVALTDPCSKLDRSPDSAGRYNE